MAMEITTVSKRLHKHAVPIVGLLLGLLTLSVIALNSYVSGGLEAEAAMARGLVTSAIHIKPSANGLAHVTLDNSEVTAGSQLDQTGRSAALSFNFQ